MLLPGFYRKTGLIIHLWMTGHPDIYRIAGGRNREREKALRTKDKILGASSLGNLQKTAPGCWGDGKERCVNMAVCPWSEKAAADEQ